MKPTKTFKLSKRTKTIMAIAKFNDDNQRHEFKNAMIQAQLASEVKVKRDPKDKSRTATAENAVE